MKSEAVKKEIDTYLSMLTPNQKESVLVLIKSFLKTDERISKKKYNAELNAAEKRVANGKFTSQEDLEAISAKW